MKKKTVTIAAAALMSTTISTTAFADFHQVQQGDTLSQIAKKYNTTVPQLKTANALQSDLIFVSQKLVIPNSASTSVQTAAPASAPVQTAAPAAAKTYTVVPGDTLIKIANAHGISLSELKTWNSIESHIIYPGQTLKVTSGGASSFPVPAPTPAPATVSTTNTNINTGNASSSQYVIKSGDTLSKIAAQFNVSIASLKSMNNISSDLIFAGQKLTVNSESGSTGGAAVQPVSKGGDGSASSQVKTSDVVSIAKSLIGAPYVYGGQTPTGFDCSGFIYYVLKQSGSSLPRYSSSGYYDRTFYVNSPQPGDFVFFENTYKPGISHMGIYLGNNQFIHAGEQGVMISTLSGYWQDHFDSFKKFLD